jgi:hypothetical protein
MEIPEHNRGTDMNFEEHLAYQTIVSSIDSLTEIMNVFERTLLEMGQWNVEARLKDARRLASDNGEQHPLRHYYNAMLLERFFKCFLTSDVHEYINLARKEKLARSMLHYLNVTKDDIRNIRKLLLDFCELPLGKLNVSPTVTLGIRVDLISRFISDHLPYVGIAKNYVNMRDVATVLSHTVGNESSPGLVGGKAAGMLLANRILKPTLSEAHNEFVELIVEPDSYFINSSVSVDFMTSNHFEECYSLKYLDRDVRDRELLRLHPLFMRGKLPEYIIEKFKSILTETRSCPLILRSSSYLEDGVGYSFTGKYDSIFISNRGSIKERLAEMTAAMKNVLFSLFGSAAMEYRKDKQLLDYNERMSILVQKVVGQQYGKYYFPACAIVGFSRNSYCWNSKIKPEDGMLRMVVGLGTRAVDRVGDDYPRMVSLSQPLLRPETSVAQKIKYSQRYIDVLNLETKKIETHHFVDLINELRDAGHHFPIRDMISVLQHGELKPPMFIPDRLEYDNCAITFDGLLSKPEFPKLMRHVLQTVEKGYNMPVDMEFVYHDSKLYPVQCRHLAMRDMLLDQVELPDVDEKDILFSADKGFPNAIIEDIEYIVYVDVESYNHLPTTQAKHEVGRVVSRLNQKLKGKNFILMGPGRWGSSNLDLGVNVNYSDINNSMMLIEMAWKKGDAAPEVSYGTHFFQDLVEADILPLPLYPDEDGIIFNKEFFDTEENSLLRFEQADEKMLGVVRVFHLPATRLGSKRKLHVYLDDTKPKGIAFLR